ncbi:Endothelial cell-specific molecule 1 [Mactra antiquata]
MVSFLDADCSITSPGVHTFGSECQYMCHCKNGESCNKTTGECTSGCDRYWFGPGCQYSDLAENEFSRQASNSKPPHWALYGIDGDTSTCSYTQVATLSTKIPWWRVVLENEVTITDIYILTTDDGLQYFPNFEVTVEKISYSDRLSHTKPSGTSVCYRHDDTVPDSTSIYVTCTTPPIGNQVRITLSTVKSQLILCDFRINQGILVAKADGIFPIVINLITCNRMLFLDLRKTKVHNRALRGNMV